MTRPEKRQHSALFDSCTHPNDFEVSMKLVFIWKTVYNQDFFSRNSSCGKIMKLGSKSEKYSRYRSTESFITIDTFRSVLKRLRRMEKRTGNKTKMKYNYYCRK